MPQYRYTPPPNPAAGLSVVRRPVRDVGRGPQGAQAGPLDRLRATGIQSSESHPLLHPAEEQLNPRLGRGGVARHVARLDALENRRGLVRTSSTFHRSNHRVMDRRSRLLNSGLISFSKLSIIGPFACLMTWFRSELCGNLRRQCVGDRVSVRSNRFGDGEQIAVLVQTGCDLGASVGKNAGPFGK